MYWSFVHWFKWKRKIDIKIYVKVKWCSDHQWMVSVKRKFVTYYSWSIINHSTNIRNSEKPGINVVFNSKYTPWYVFILLIAVISTVSHRFIYYTVTILFDITKAFEAKFVDNGMSCIRRGTSIDVRHTTVNGRIGNVLSLVRHQATI